MKWIHGTYLKNRDIWLVQAKSGDSWMWKQILKTRDKALFSNGGVDNLMQLINSCVNNSKVQMSVLYHALSANSVPVPWYNTVWEGISYPKHSFLSWLAVQNRLQTQDRLLKRGIITSNSCCLCTRAEENRDHLFFDCLFSSEVWLLVMDWLKFSWRSCVWNHIMNWYCYKLRGKGDRQKIKRMALSSTLYCIWIERNNRIFKNKFRNAVQVFGEIKISMLYIILNSTSLLDSRDWILSL
ncbi:uncharacterized protein LOC109837456 [Asparagus officinalis]|uniref:uncharacterized protein LOC109837456 n=1 Tax=Asparagus officinalis TaxID=4686 RepID=UPI00098E2A42|nr:uncharacterized protein LOC109837456 [Asparagus officinalis]